MQETGGAHAMPEKQNPSTDSPLLQSTLNDWGELNPEFDSLAAEFENYKKKLEEMKTSQKKCLSAIAHVRFRTKRVNENIRNIVDPSPADKKHLDELHLRMSKQKNVFRDYEDHLPHTNGLYLKIILGQVNVSLLNKEDKYLYKQDYETFKLLLSYIIFALSLLLVTISYITVLPEKIRWMDSVLHFLLVWYYCTLTIREQILIVNGSRIKGWWMAHHFVSTACSAITLIWPDSWSYRYFRTQYGWFILFVAFTQVLQYYYQRGCLYRLKALGQRHDMDITVEGFMSWMFKGLAFLLPFLFTAYFFQLYNAYVLYLLSYNSKCKEWQVIVLSAIHLILFLGNMATTLKVIQQKLTEDLRNSKKFYKNKYRFNTKPKEN